MPTAVIAEEVATNLEEVAEVTRKISASAVGYFGFGVVVGAAIGMYYGYRFSKEKLRAEAFEESKAEVEQIRAAYALRTAAKEKPRSAEEIVKDRGYSVVKPEDDGPDRLLKPPVAIPGPGPINYHRGPPLPEEKAHVNTWDYDAELAKRDIDGPHVIHQDEYHETHDGLRRPEWQQMAFTYYDRDDVLTDENNNPIHNPEEIVGHHNLRFGVGSDDPDVVFIRNPNRMLEMEIHRVDKSFEEVVMGLDADDQA